MEKEFKDLIEVANEVRKLARQQPGNENKSDDEIDQIILDLYLKAYTEGKISKGDLEAFTHAMGYEFTDEFINDPLAVDDFAEVDK